MCPSNDKTGAKPEPAGTSSPWYARPATSDAGCQSPAIVKGALIACRAERRVLAELPCPQQRTDSRCPELRFKKGRLMGLLHEAAVGVQ